MRFRYRGYPVPALGIPLAAKIVHRPMVTCRFIDPTGDIVVLGLADTGADETLLPEGFAAALGVALKPGSVAIGGVGGASIIARYADVDLEIVTPRSARYRWSAEVGFYPGRKVILGRRGFLDHFTASFNGRGLYLDLRPNGTAPPASIQGL